MRSRRNTVAFEHMCVLALSPEKSATMIRDVAEEFAHGEPNQLAIDLGSVPWHKSSFSGDQGAGVVFFTSAEMDAWIKGIKAGEFDDLALA
jgi:hypothetical protein